MGQPPITPDFVLRLAHAVGRVLKRSDEHPTVLTEIHLEFAVHGQGIDRAVVEQAIAVAGTQLAPVWVMVKAGTPVATSVRLDDD